MYKVLFVCTGNICRSPSAEAVFRDMVKREGLSAQIAADSCGMGAWHVGDPPDRRSQATALERGVDMSALRARQIKAADFDGFDLLLAMDRGHLKDMRRMAPAGTEEKVQLFMDYAPSGAPREVPDPYYGGEEGFSEVFTLIEKGSKGLLVHIRKSL